MQAIIAAQAVKSQRNKRGGGNDCCMELRSAQLDKRRLERFRHDGKESSKDPESQVRKIQSKFLLTAGIILVSISEICLIAFAFLTKGRLKVYDLDYDLTLILFGIIGISCLLFVLIYFYFKRLNDEHILSALQSPLQDSGIVSPQRTGPRGSQGSVVNQNLIQKPNQKPEIQINSETLQDIETI